MKKFTHNFRDCRGSAPVPALKQWKQPRGDCPYRYFIYEKSPVNPEPLACSEPIVIIGGGATTGGLPLQVFYL
jgi:hypothetical protein